MIILIGNIINIVANILIILVIVDFGSFIFSKPFSPCPRNGGPDRQSSSRTHPSDSPLVGMLDLSPLIL